jgi:sugar/nucleoside kinase (ribokinase family)
MLDIIGIGKPVKDLLASIKEMPPQDGAALVRSFSSQGGGKVASAMVAASRLGMRCACLCQSQNPPEITK